MSLIGSILCFKSSANLYIYILCIKLYSIKGTFKICVVWILNVLMEKSTYTIHLYKYKNTRIGLCIIFLLSFSFTKVLYVQTMALDGGTVYCITIIIFHVSLFSTRPVSVLGPCMCRLWPHGGTDPRKVKKNQCGPGCLTGKLQNQSRLNGPGESRAVDAEHDQ